MELIKKNTWNKKSWWNSKIMEHKSEETQSRRSFQSCHQDNLYFSLPAFLGIGDGSPARRGKTRNRTGLVISYCRTQCAVPSHLYCSDTFKPNSSTRFLNDDTVPATHTRFCPFAERAQTGRVFAGWRTEGNCEIFSFIQSPDSSSEFGKRAKTPVFRTFGKRSQTEKRVFVRYLWPGLYFLRSENFLIVEDPLTISKIEREFR